jgi:hypothetical protein
MAQDFVVVDPRKAELLAQRASKELVVITTQKVAMLARTMAPGSMKERIRAVPSSGIGLVVSDHPATMFVIYKTRAHKIYPKRPGGVLRFKKNGKVIFAKSVNHPGNQHPNNFLLKALEAAKF